MSVREDFLALLRTDQNFHEEVRRQLLTEEVLSLPKRVDRLTEVVSEKTSLLQETVKLVQGLTRSQLQVEQRLDRVETSLAQLAEAQRHTEEALKELLSWQRGEAGRRD